MGFWDKVRSVTDKITGKGADVDVVFPDQDLELGEPFTIRVVAKIGPNDIEVKNVELKLEAHEHIEAEGIEVEYEDGEQEVEHEVVRKDSLTYEDEVEVPVGETLEAGETYEWEVELTIPEELNGSYQGVFANHEYAALAVLDAPGNDPESDWVAFEIY